MNRQYRNEPLQNLPYEAVEGLQLRAIDLELNHELEYPGQPIRHVFLSGRGVGSMKTTFRDGSQVGAA